MNSSQDELYDEDGINPRVHEGTITVDTQFSNRDTSGEKRLYTLYGLSTKFGRVGPH